MHIAAIIMETRLFAEGRSSAGEELFKAIKLGVLGNSASFGRVCFNTFSFSKTISLLLLLVLSSIR
jgi:hypothetical protein